MPGRSLRELDDPPSTAVIGIILAVFAGALFNAIATALDALGPARLRAIAESETDLSMVARRVLDQGLRVRDRLLVARVACVASDISVSVRAVPTHLGVGWAATTVVGVSFFYVLIAQVASAVARRRPSVVVLQLVRALRPLELLLAPITYPLELLRLAVDRLVPELVESPGQSERIVELAVEHVLEENEAEGDAYERHTELLWNVLEFNHTISREIMVPRTQVVSFDIDTPIREVVDRIIDSQHSRYPVYRGTLDHVEGVLFAKDLFRAIREGGYEGVRLSDIVRKPVFFAAETQKIGDVLRAMQSKRIHLAVVTDEFGGASGVVTLEDIVEEIVGEIQDEHDEEEPLVHESSPGLYVVNAGISIYDLAEHVGEDLPHEGDFDSLGGLVVHLAGRVPAAGETVQTGPFELRVLEADQRRVLTVQITRRASAPPRGAAVEG